MRIYEVRFQPTLLMAFSILFWACGDWQPFPVREKRIAAAADAELAPKQIQERLLAGAELARVKIATRAQDKTLAPYFFVDDDSAVDALPLKSTHAEVRIMGAIADVQVRQTYRNQGPKAIEAIYIFPASTRAAVHALKMTIGKRVIEAQIRERDAARREYDTARRQGKIASLLEQQRPNVFQMNVANIQPGDEIQVELRYAELIVPEHHIYEFVYPTTVGPRYSNKPENQAKPEDRFISSPNLPAGADAAHSFALDAIISGGVPISAIAVPSHPTAQIAQHLAATAQIKLPPSSDTGNRDFVMRYVLEGPSIESGILLETGEKENHFLLMMEPPARIEAKGVLPREYIFVVDVSGSMAGFPLETSKQLMQRLFLGLRPQDQFNIMSFSGGNVLLSPSSLPATSDNVKQAMEFTQSWIGAGGTELLPALRKAMTLPRQKGMSRTIVVITDGFISVEQETFALIRDSLSDTNVFAFGIGSSVNRFLIEGMARAGQAEPFIILNEKDAEEKAAAFQSYINSPILQGVRARFAGLDVYDVEPAVLPDLFSEKPIVVQGKYRGTPQGQVIISGRSATGRFEQTIEIAKAARPSSGTVLSTLWARKRIERLSDWERVGHSSAQKADILALGLQYHLMTAYTSFIAVDSAAQAESRASVTVHQPSPMPAGVSNFAISASALGRDAEDSMGGLVGTEVGEAYGSGFGIVGSGSGGGGGVTETFGMGSLGRGSVGLYGASAGKLRGRSSGAPVVNPGIPTIHGIMAPLTILRIIRRHINELRFCYESELTRKPTLQGRVVLQFTIAMTGAVSISFVESSTMASPPTEQCMANAVRRWEFPKPSLGIVSVSIPFVLKSDAAN